MCRSNSDSDIASQAALLCYQAPFDAAPTACQPACACGQQLTVATLTLAIACLPHSQLALPAQPDWHSVNKQAVDVAASVASAAAAFCCGAITAFAAV